MSRNLYYRNNRDLFVEVSHGPYLVEHNVLASPAAIESFSQGGAFVHNLIGGTVSLEQVMDRATPYHLPHSTQVAGYAVIYGADDRFIGNIFLGGDISKAYARMTEAKQPPRYGTAGYDGHPATFDEYLARVADQPSGDLQRFIGLKQPAYFRDNVYAPGAQAFAGERSALALAEDVALEVVEEGDEVFLDVLATGALREPSPRRGDRRRPAASALGRRQLRRARRQPIGLGRRPARRAQGGGARLPAGPIANLAPGTSRTRVW